MGLFQSFYTNSLPPKFWSQGFFALAAIHPFFTTVPACALPLQPSSLPDQRSCLTPSRGKEKSQHCAPSLGTAQETDITHTQSQQSLPAHMQSNWGPVLSGSGTQTGSRPQTDPPKFRSTVCFPVPSRSWPKFFKPFFLAGGSLPSLSQQSFQQPKVRKYSRC